MGLLGTPAWELHSHANIHESDSGESLTFPWESERVSISVFTFTVYYPNTEDTCPQFLWVNTWEAYTSQWSCSKSNRKLASHSPYRAERGGPDTLIP